MRVKVKAKARSFAPAVLKDDPEPNLYADVCKQNLLRGKHELGLPRSLCSPQRQWYLKNGTVPIFSYSTKLTGKGKGKS